MRSMAESTGWAPWQRALNKGAAAGPPVPQRFAAPHVYMPLMKGQRMNDYFRHCTRQTDSSHAS